MVGLLFALHINPQRGDRSISIPTGTILNLEKDDLSILGTRRKSRSPQNAKGTVNKNEIFTSANVAQPALLNGYVPDGLAHAATAFVESLKINTISEKIRRGRPVVHKRRNALGAQMAEMANLYFRLAKLPLRYLTNVREWQRWEVRCFLMLNGDRYRASASRGAAVWLDKLPGQNIWDHMKEGRLTRQMLESAGREIYRAHQFWSDELGARWSHGDASMPNVMYNEKSGRARLIDFEISHDKSLSATTRQADDLLIFVLDMVGNVTSRQWVPFTTSFLRAYGDPDVIAELKKQLVIPTGLALVWWNVRSNFAKTSTVKRRLASLRNAINQLELDRPARARAATKSGALRRFAT